MYKFIIIAAIALAAAQATPTGTYQVVAPYNTAAYNPVVYTHTVPYASTKLVHTPVYTANTYAHTVPVATHKVVHAPVTYTVPAATTKFVQTPVYTHVQRPVVYTNTAPVVHTPVVYNTAKVVQTYKPVEQHGYQIAY